MFSLVIMICVQNEYSFFLLASIHPLRNKNISMYRLIMICFCSLHYTGKIDRVYN